MFQCNSWDGIKKYFANDLFGTALEMEGMQFSYESWDVATYIFSCGIGARFTFFFSNTIQHQALAMHISRNSKHKKLLGCKN